MPKDNEAPVEVIQGEEPDMSWVDVAVCGPGHCVVIVDCAPGLPDFIDELFFEDNFVIDAPMHLMPGLYRWSGYKIGMWDEGDHINITGGEFIPLAYQSEAPAQGEGELRACVDALFDQDPSNNPSWNEIDRGEQGWLARLFSRLVLPLADREAIARDLCNAAEPRLIAGQEDAPGFDESTANVQEYWLAIADAILALSGSLPPSPVGEGT